MPRLFTALLVALVLPQLVLTQPTWAETPASKEQIRLSFAPVVKQVAPAVVNIYTKRVVRAQVSPLMSDPLFSRFFGEMLPPGMTQERVQRSLGSGVITSEDGTVITNRHVIKDADEVTVVLSDRREFEAKILGADEHTDLAVLKIDTKGEKLPVLPFGDSDSLEVGDLLLAIGNPFGVGQTVTSGIVSALARTNVTAADTRSFIQTDAAINPGNSGGALVDMNGKLVGINTAIYSKDGSNVGIGFAIPTALVKVVLNGLTHDGRVVRAWLGARGQAVTQEIAQAIHMKRPTGVLINQIVKNSPAEQGGLKVGDVVTSVQGKEVDDPEGMRFRLATLPVGGSATLTVERNGTEQNLDIRLVAPPEQPAREPTDINGANPLSGTTLANLNPALAEEIGMPTTSSGVVVMRILNNSIARRLQIQPGDIILAVNDQKVLSVSDAKRLLAGKAQQWRITLNRDGQTLSLMING